MSTNEGLNPVVTTVEQLHRELGTGQDPLLLDVRWRLGDSAEAGRVEYLAGHIPGAIHVDLEQQLCDPTGGAGRHPLPCPDEFEQTARRLGVCNDRPIVVMDADTGLAAARLWWLLTDAGHEDVSILDGGFAAWRAAGHAVETGDVRPDEGWFIAETGDLDVIEADDIDTDSTTVWDVRAPERFNGEVEPIDAVAGHIPGARNLPAADLFVDGRLRPRAELEELLSEVADGDVISCGSGITACQVIWVLYSIGRTDVTLYAGSWSDWISDPSRPVAVGVETARS